MEEEKKGTKTISTRINERLHTDVKIFCKEHNIKTSDFLRKSLLYYIKFKEFHERANNPIMIYSKVEIKFLLSKLYKKDLEDLAEICFQNGKLTMQHYTQKYIEQGLEELEINPRTLIKSLNVFVFSKDGQNWFNNVDYFFPKKKFIFKGIHNLTLNFSIFIKHFLIKYMREFNYELVKEKLQESELVLNFKKKR